jgi:hypothetical protein
MTPPKSTEAFRALAEESGAFEIRHRIRRHATESRAKLDLVLSLMAYQGSAPICEGLDDRIEAYLCLRTPELLRDLLALLDMPDDLANPVATAFSRAA